MFAIYLLIKTKNKMENQEKQMTGEESLALIQSMIDKAQNKIAEDGFEFLLWGVLVILASIMNYALLKMGYDDKAGLVWLIMPVIGVPISIIYNRRKAATELVRTYIERAVGNIWMAYGVTLFFIIFYCVKMELSPIPFILLVTGMATFNTGLTIQFKPLTIGGISFWAFGIISFFVIDANVLLLNALAIFTGYIIPGMLLRRQHKLAQHV